MSTQKPLKNAIFIIVADGSKKTIYNDVFRRAFLQFRSSRKILKSFRVFNKLPLSPSHWRVTYNCDFDFDALSTSSHNEWNDFYEYFLEACVEFCRITENEDLKLWLSTDISQAFNPPSDDYLSNYMAVSGIELSEFSIGALEDRCTFVGHLFYDETCSRYRISAYFDDDHSFRVDFGYVKKNKRKYRYRMQIRYDSLDEVILVDEAHSTSCCIYFMLRIPSHVYRWRYLYLKEPKDIGKIEKRRILSTENVSADDLGNSSVLRLTVRDSDYKKAREVISRLRDLRKQIHWAYIAQKLSEDCAVNAKPNFNGNFQMQYALECLLSRGYTVTDRIASLYEDLVDLSSSQYNAAEKSVQQLALQIENDRFIDLRQQFRKNMKELKKLDNDNLNDDDSNIDNCFYVRRAIITPTRCLFLQPELAFGNRVLRKYGGEYCLRVLFRDENFSKLSNYEASAAEEISNRIEDLLNSGIQIGSRHYEFLACSNSQLRDHGCWLYAKDNQGNCASDIRNWMGDFSEIHCVASYVARMGQCFSKSEESVDVSQEGVDIRAEEDIKRLEESIEYCFSDGIGKVSRSLAKKVCGFFNFQYDA